jgi:hypothetical protein
MSSKKLSAMIFAAAVGFVAVIPFFGPLAGIGGGAVLAILAYTMADSHQP